jgi:hypothetical protein
MLQQVPLADPVGHAPAAVAQLPAAQAMAADRLTNINQHHLEQKAANQPPFLFV